MYVVYTYQYTSYTYTPLGTHILEYPVVVVVSLLHDDKTVYFI